VQTACSANNRQNGSRTLTVTLRPLRLAFIITPGDSAAISDAIRINSYLWGGQYNAIIPLFRRLPTWLPPWSRPANAAGFFRSYLDLFEPDFVVRLGSTADGKIDLGNLKEVSAKELLRPIDAHDSASYGIGLFEILQHLLDQEFRFVRNDTLQIRIPSVGNDLFLSSVFGVFPDQLPSDIANGLRRNLSRLEVPCNRDNYVEFFAASNLFVRRICDYGIKTRRRSWWWGDYVFLMDGDDPNDVLLYWNYRALGWKILPVAIQSVRNEVVRKYVSAFVEANYWPMRGNPSLYNHTTVLSSPNITEDQLKEFVASLELKSVPKDVHAKTSLCSWLPRFWDEWAREKDGADRSSIWAQESRTSIKIENNSFQFEPLMPEFAREFAGQGTPRCANQLELSIYGDKHEYAQVIPEGGDKVARAAHFAGIHNVKCSSEGIIFFSTLTRWTETMAAPSSEAIFTAWFEERGWRVSISDKGHIIKQLLRQIGGLWRINWLTEEPVLRLLMEIPRLGPIRESDFRARLTRVTNSGRHVPADSLAKWLVESNIVRLGLDIACPKCFQRSWYSVSEADYELVCRQCLETYRLPAETLKQMPWTYRGAGAFGGKVEVIVQQTSVGLEDEIKVSGEVLVPNTTKPLIPVKIPDGLQGGLSVLLLLHLLSRDMQPSLTSLLSFNAPKGDEKLEVDLALFTRHMRSGVYQSDVVFAECKSFHGRFVQRDIRRMEKFARHFPGAVVIFSTLRRELDLKEKRLLIPFVNRGRKFLTATRPNTPVVIFTGNELFSWKDPRNTWRELGPPFSHHADEYGDDRVFVSLADATQQLYLGLPSIHSRRAETPARRQKPNVTQTSG
jgi:hypothetical protein